MTDFLNDIILSKDVVDSLFNMDEDVSKACDSKAKEICKTLFPKVDLSREENIELVIRPMSAVIALNELLLQNIFSMSSIDGVYTSTTIPEQTKIPILKNYALLNNIQTVSVDIHSLFSEIKFGMNSASMNRETSVKDVIYNNTDKINRIMFIDSSCGEMDRNKIPYIQINHLKVMDFERTDMNQGTLIGTGYNREDYQKYQDYKNAETVNLPGVLDIYHSSGLIEETITATKNTNGVYKLGNGFYIGITHASKDVLILENDILNWGIVDTDPSVYMFNGEAEEEFNIVRYNYVNFSESVDSDEFTIMDVLFKGFYPMFVDFIVYGKHEVDTARLLNSINEYLDSVGGDMHTISHNDMSDYVRAEGDNVVFSSTNQATVFTTININFETEITFPLTMKDVLVPVELKRSSISERTVRVFARSVNVIKE